MLRLTLPTQRRNVRGRRLPAIWPKPSLLLFCCRMASEVRISFSGSMISWRLACLTARGLWSRGLRTRCLAKTLMLMIRPSLRSSPSTDDEFCAWNRPRATTLGGTTPCSATCEHRDKGRYDARQYGALLTDDDRERGEGSYRSRSG